MNIQLRKILGAIFILLWSVIILSAFYITQHPLFPKIIYGTLKTVWAVILLLLILIDSAGIGLFLFKRLSLEAAPHEQLILGTGLGLGGFGLSGYGLAALGLAHSSILLIILTVVLMWIFFSGIRTELWVSLKSFLQSFQQNKGEVPLWLPFAVLAGTMLGFCFALLPPAEGFDALSYHLALPERLLADGKILPYDIVGFWVPGLMEGNFIWALGLYSERTAQLLHWAFSILTFGLIWEWSRNTLNHKSAWWSLGLLISMPSLPWLASWAYNDFALAFYELACLYALWKWNESKLTSWLYISGGFAGMAMGIKYTSVILPIFCVILLFLWGGTIFSKITSITSFSLTGLLVGCPWYIRNWIIMENPVYPLIFGGRGWDLFQTASFVGARAGIGTGIGWNPLEIIMIPFNIMLGHRDQTFYDSRIGPLFLLFLPLAFWALWKKLSASNSERKTLFILSAFTLLNYLVWMFGVIQTRYLWQARYLLPGLIPFAIPIGLGISLLTDLDLPNLRISFIAALITALVIAATLLDNSLLLMVRRPIEYSLGVEDRQEYFERIQPNYSKALRLVETTPQDSYVYFMFEPRSYNMPRKVQSDMINNNLLHDFYLFGKPETVVNHWKSKGYTHILIFTSAMDENFKKAFNQILPYLQLELEDGDYKLYIIKS